MRNYSIVLSMLLLVIGGCQNETLPDNDSEDCIEVTELEASCGFAILRIENPAFYHYGETINDYQNVFIAKVPCPDATIAQINSAPTKIFVKISTKPFPETRYDCFRCATPTYGATKYYYIQYVPSWPENCGNN